MAFDAGEDTKLIDISDLREPHAEEFSQEETHVEDFGPEPTIGVARSEPSYAVSEQFHKTPLAEPIETGPSRIATFSERFTAFCIDSMLLVYLYWGGVQLYHQIRIRHWAGPAPTNLEWSGLAFHGAFLLAAFLYYFLCEGIFLTTLGKFVCWMSVRRTDGRLPSLTAIFLRNIFRPIDYIPFFLPGLLGFFVMELTRRHQRLGDLIANTTVVKRQGSTTRLSVAYDHLASTTGRFMAGTIDLAFVGGIAISLLLLLNDEHIFFSFWLFLTMPALLVFFWTLVQRLAHTTPGCWICGYTIVQENGARLGTAHAFLRTLLIPIDLCLIGPFALIFSPRHQRVGDMIAGTLVVQSKRHMAGLIGLVISTVAVLGLAYGASLNPRTWIDRDLTINPEFLLAFIPRTELAPQFPPIGGPTAPFSLSGFRFAVGDPNTTRSPAVYVPGETAWFVFEVNGFVTKSRKIWIQEDLSIRYPDNTFGLRQENIIDERRTKRRPGPLVLKNNIQLPYGIQPGPYTVFITVRDRLAATTQVVHTETFYIKPVPTSAPPETTTEAPAPPPPGGVPPARTRTSLGELPAAQ